MVIDEELIEHYMKLEKKITKAKERIIRQRELFYSQTMSSYLTTDGMRVYSKGFSLEWNVSEFIDREAASKQHLEILEFQQQHFKPFFNNLPINTKIALQEKYWHHHPVTIEIIEKRCMDEINEIEEACNYRFKNYGFVDPVEDEFKKINDSLNEGDFEDSFENSFEKMLSALGG